MSTQQTVSLALPTTCLAGSLASAALAGKPRNQRPVPNVRPIVIHASHGFNWGDATIGAAAGLGTAVAALGGITLARNK